MVIDEKEFVEWDEDGPIEIEERFENLPFEEQQYNMFPGWGGATI